MFRIVLQGGADLPDGEVQALFEVYECFRAPDFLGQVLPGDDFARPADQQGQNFGGLRLELYGSSIPAQFSRTQIQCEVGEEYDRGGTRMSGQTRSPQKGSPNNDWEHYIRDCQVFDCL
jgi:hypothetical protein